MDDTKNKIPETITEREALEITINLFREVQEEKDLLKFRNEELEEGLGLIRGCKMCSVCQSIADNLLSKI